MRQPKKRIIYDNYDLWNDYADDAREYLIDEGFVEKGDEPNENDIWSEIYEIDRITWDEEKPQLEEFFNGNDWILMGYSELWYGKRRAGTVFSDFNKMLDTALKDCDYLSIYDENGHLYLKCSHHDGTNLYEIKQMTNKGKEYLERWEYSFDKRTEEQCHEQIWKRYSRLPNFANKVYGCKRREFM